MKTSHLVDSIGRNFYLKYNRLNLLNFLKYSQAVDFDVHGLICSHDFKQIDKMLKSKITSYYAAKHYGFVSLAEYFDGRDIVELSSMVSAARKSFQVKPASWFRTEDAYNILIDLRENFGVTKVLDPFHGWGARLMASKCAGIGYVGIDANPLLHRELTAIDPNASLYLANSFEFDYSKISYDGVFTCPPYWICEQYGYRIGYPKTYALFVKKLCDLFVLLSKQARFQFVSVEDFTVKGCKYTFEFDFMSEMSRRGFKVEEVTYRKMYRSFQGDYRDLKYFVLHK